MSDSETFPPVFPATTKYVVDDMPPGVPDVPSNGGRTYEVIHLGQLHAGHLGRVITFDAALGQYAQVHVRVTGELREVHHDAGDTTINVTDHRGESNGSKEEFSLPYLTPVAVWDE